MEEKRSKTMDIGEMWKLTNREENNWGIEGYEAPKKYNDARQQVWERRIYEENQKVWAKKGHYEKKQMVDKDGNPIVLKRPNYLDEVTKWATSYYNKVRADDILERKPDLLKTGKKEEKPSKEKSACKMYKSGRMLYTDWLILFEKNKTAPRLEEIKDLDKIMEKINAKKAE